MRGEKENEYIDCPSDRLKGKISKLWYTEKEPGMVRWYLRMECAGNLLQHPVKPRQGILSSTAASA